ncbi:MAG: PDZ domain-containing protein, partial [Planctomycetales bacterium]|nr:PDZ domain-containing protein [Planctomycetales bacterium]
TLGATVSTDASGKVLVSNILSLSDAYRRGLRYGDEIIGLADREVRSTNHFKNILGTLPKDWRVPLVIRRDGKTRTLLVRLDGVHSEKQLIDLVNSEASEMHGGPQPDPNKELDKQDELDQKHGRDKQLEDDFEPQAPHDADSHPAPADSSGEDSSGTELSDAAQLEPGQPNKALVESMLIERSGFANYYYNRLHRNELWERCHQQSDFAEETGPWTFTGSVAGESTPVSVVLFPDRGEMHVGSRTLTAELTDRMSDVVAQRRETGLLVALHALQQFLTLGPERIGDTIYLGTLPVYAGTSTMLADAPRQAVLQSLWYDAKVRFSFDSTTGLVSLVEVFGDAGQDPVELYVDQYAPLVAGAKSKPLLPSRIRLQYGTEPRLLLSIESVTLGAAAKPQKVAPGAQPAALPAASPAIDQQTRRRGLVLKHHFVATQSISSQEPVAPANGSHANGIPANAEQPGTARLTTLRHTGSIHAVAVATELNTVKLYGAGGVANLDAYQSGFFISAEGHVLTSWSTVLDVDTVFAVTSDGGRYESKVLGIDPNLEIAVLATGQATSHFFDLQQAVDPPVGSRVLAFSNLYGIATGSEMSSVQKGVIMARTELNARRGSFASVYQGPVFIIDAMTNNPGAAGGALTTFDGRLVGMLGKEMRDASSNTWLNYAIPISLMKESIERLLSGKSIQRAAIARRTVDRPTSLKYLGIVLVPNVLAKTPAFVDQVQPASLAAIAGLRNDDLILFINSRRVSSQAALLEELTTIDRADKVTLLVQRDNQLQEIVLAP